MKTYVFDTSGLIRYVDQEAGAERIAEILDDVNRGTHSGVISAVNWGEVKYTLRRKRGLLATSATLSLFRSLGIQIVPADAERACRAANIKTQFGIAYADCFGVELAQDSQNHILITADFDVKPADHLIQIEFLPPK